MATTRQDLLREAENAARRGDLARAAEIYARILERTPNDLAIRQRLADALARTGREDEARDVFRRLADDYWNGGYRARALAVLRRAVRLGRPDPELLSLLGERTLEQGLVADAREPLLLAARAWEGRGDGARASEAWRRLADAFPRDVESRRALVRLAEAAGDPGEKARARARLAEVLARTGDPEGAVAAFREALAIDRARLAALDALPSLLPPLVEAAPLPDAGLFRDDDPAVDAGLVLLRASLDHHAGRPADPAPVAGLVDREDLPPRVALWAGRVLLDLGDTAGAQRGILGGARRLRGGEEEVRDLLIGSLSGLLTRDPGAADAMELLEELTAATAAGEPGPAPEPVPAGEAPAEASRGWREAASAPEEPEKDEAVPPARGEVDPSHLAARLIEARRLLAHGLPERARVVLEEMGADAEGVEGYREVREQVEAALRGPAREAEASPPSAPAPEVIALGDGTDTGEDDGFEIVLDDFDDDEDAGTSPATGKASPAPAGGEGAPSHAGHREPAAAVPGGGAPQPREPGLDLGRLAEEVRAAVSGEDAETTFQMGLGLVQMGLLDDAAGLLAPVLASRERGWDAALILARAFLEAGRSAESLATGFRVLDAGLPRDPDVERELIGVLLEAARSAGDQGRVDELKGRLAALPEPA